MLLYSILVCSLTCYLCIHLTCLGCIYSLELIFTYCSGPFLCFARLPHAVQLLYWAKPPAVLGPSILSKGIEIGPIGTQIGLACAQIMPCLPRACLRQAKLF